MAKKALKASPAEESLLQFILVEEAVVAHFKVHGLAQGLRFLGAANHHIRRIILFEAGMLGVLANIAGVTLGFILSLLLIHVINKQSFGWTIQFHTPGMVMLGSLTVVYIATVLAGLFPARIAVRLDPMEVVHEE